MHQPTLLRAPPGAASADLPRAGFAMTERPGGRPRLHAAAAGCAHALRRVAAAVLIAVVVAAAPGTALAQEGGAPPPAGDGGASQIDPAPSAAPGTAFDAVPAAPGDAVPAAEPEAADARLPHDLSPIGMFSQADFVVKAVMIGLVLASLLTWTVAIAKSIEIAVARRRLATGCRVLARAASLEAAAAALPDGAARALAEAALDEGDLSDGLAAAGVKERAELALSRISASYAHALRRGTGVLATIGATAPFVGLFGTVWGIMNAFIGISVAQTTNLAVVAPGIAEALFATALGLVAAIPAVVIYNHVARRIADLRQLLADAEAEVTRLLSRDLDRRQPRGLAAAAE